MARFAGVLSLAVLGKLHELFCQNYTLLCVINYRDFGVPEL